jgi:hypothetical protein
MFPQTQFPIHQGRNSVNITDTISEKKSNVFNPQRKFIAVLPTAIMLMRGRINSGNSGCYSELSGKTFSRQFRTPSDFTQFNGIGMSIKPHTSVIAAPDCSFVPTHIRTCRILQRNEAEKGLEISELAAANVISKLKNSYPLLKRLPVFFNHGNPQIL